MNKNDDARPTLAMVRKLARAFGAGEIDDSDRELALLQGSRTTAVWRCWSCSPPSENWSVRDLDFAGVPD